MDRQSAPEGAREWIMSEEFYKSWNIKGVAQSVIKENNTASMFLPCGTCR